MNKTALITGAGGFVGKAFCRRLLEDGWFVIGVDDLSAGQRPCDWTIRPKNAVDSRWWYTDHNFCWSEDTVKFWSAWSSQSYDLVVHCAAVVGGRLKIEGDPLAVATDLAIDSALFNWAVCSKPKKIIYFSSSAVYPVEFQRNDKYQIKLSESLTHHEGTRIGRPDMTYGWAKLTGEYLAKQAIEKYGLDVVIYRPFSGYGEDQSLDYPFPSIVERVCRGDNPVTIWGSGDQIRDFIHIDDIVECVLQTMDVLKPGEVLNLGSGIPISFRQLAAIAHTEVAAPTSPCNIVTDTSKPEGVFYRVADTWKMSQFYTPKVSLEEGIRRVAAHLTKK
jgi:UDP-glucose 4-epimerase